MNGAVLALTGLRRRQRPGALRGGAFIRQLRRRQLPRQVGLCLHGRRLDLLHAVDHDQRLRAIDVGDRRAERLCAVGVRRQRVERRGPEDGDPLLRHERPEGVPVGDGLPLRAGAGAAHAAAELGRHERPVRRRAGARPSTAYMATNPGSLGAPFPAGQTFWMQGWFRDSVGAEGDELLGTGCSSRPVRERRPRAGEMSRMERPAGGNPGAGAVVQAQLWYRDPFNTANNQATSLSDAIEFLVLP